MFLRRVWSDRRCLPEIGIDVKNGLCMVLEPLAEQGAPAR